MLTFDQVLFMLHFIRQTHQYQVSKHSWNDYPRCYIRSNTGVGWVKNKVIHVRIKATITSDLYFAFFIFSAKDRHDPQCLRNRMESPLLLSSFFSFYLSLSVSVGFIYTPIYIQHTHIINCVAHIHTSIYGRNLCTYQNFQTLFGLWVSKKLLKS